LADLAFRREVREEVEDTGYYGRTVGRVRVGSLNVHAVRREDAALDLAAAIARPDSVFALEETLLAMTCKVDIKSLLLPVSSSQENVEFMQMFGSIADPEHRTALVTMARMMSSAPQQTAQVEAVSNAA
jgi:hypothetical protein